MGHIRQSPEIYRLGKVFVVLAPVVNYHTGEIMNMKMASKIVDIYQPEFRKWHWQCQAAPGHLSGLAIAKIYTHYLIVLHLQDDMISGRWQRRPFL